LKLIEFFFSSKIFQLIDLFYLFFNVQTEWVVVHSHFQVTDSVTSTTENETAFLTEAFVKEQAERLLGLARHHGKRRTAANINTTTTTTASATEAS
jgi:hypothetical protein